MRKREPRFGVVSFPVGQPTPDAAQLLVLEDLLSPPSWRSRAIRARRMRTLSKGHWDSGILGLNNFNNSRLGCFYDTRIFQYGRLQSIQKF